MQQSYNHTFTTHMALSWINFCPGPAGYSRHFLTVISHAEVGRVGFGSNERAYLLPVDSESSLQSISSNFVLWKQTNCLVVIQV